jgi:hypothetical protein
MITVYLVDGRILIFPTGKFVEHTPLGHKIYDKKGGDWLGTVSVNAAIVSGNGPVDEPEQRGLF